MKHAALDPAAAPLDARVVDAADDATVSPTETRVAPSPGLELSSRALAAAAAALTLLAATAGLVDQGLYAPSTSEALLPGVASQDIVSLIAAVGVLLCVRAGPAGDGRVRLVLAGLLVYLFYAYALYAFDGVYNALFLVYVAIPGLALYAVVGLFAGIDLDATFPPGRRSRFSRRALAAYLLVLVVIFAALWTTLLVPAMRTRTAPPGAAVFVLDLAIFLPLTSLVAVLLWRGRPLGDVLAVPLLVKLGTLGLSVLLGSLLVPLYGRALSPGDVALYATMGLVPFAALPKVLGALRGPSREHA